MTKTLLIAASLLIASAASAVAAPSHRQIDARQNRQLNAIEEGRQTGQITWREGMKLRAQQHRIRSLERAYGADGHLSKTERSNLSARQDQARGSIAREKHDRWHRLWWLPRFGR